MSFLNDTVTSRQLVLLCARIFVQYAMAWSAPQPGTDVLNPLSFPPCTSGKPIARRGQELIAPPPNAVTSSATLPRCSSLRRRLEY